MHTLRVLLTATVLVLGFASAPALADQPAFDRSVVAGPDNSLGRVDGAAGVLYGGGSNGDAMSSGGGGSAAVAEPGSLVLIGLGLIALVGGTRRRR